MANKLWQGLNVIIPEITASHAQPNPTTTSGSESSSKNIHPGCYVIYSPTVPSAGFHFMGCSVLRADCDHSWTGGYRKTCDLSGNFTVFVKEKDSKKKTLQVQALNVCPVCLAEWNNNQGWKSFSLNDEQKERVRDFTVKGHSKILYALYRSLDTQQQKAIYDFSLEEFFAAFNYQSQIPSEILDVIYDYRVDPDNPYPIDWRNEVLRKEKLDSGISRIHRIADHHRCEECGAELIDIIREKPDILVVHHINGLHSDVRPENLRVLCKLCHSKQWRHDTTVTLTSSDIETIEEARKPKKSSD